MNSNQLANPVNTNWFFIPKVMVLCAFVFLTGSSYAQKGFYAGLSTGIQAFSLVNTKDQAAGAELNFNLKSNVPIGIGGGYNINKHIGVSLDLIYSKQTQGYTGQAVANPDSNVYSTQIRNLANLNGIALTGSYTSDVVLSCLKIPILFHLNSNNKKRIYLGIYAGPQIDVISNVTFHVNGQETPLKGTNITPKDVYNRSVLDGVLGLGIGVNLTSYLTLNGSLRFDYSMGDVERKNELLTYNNVQYRYYSTTREPTHTATAGLNVGIYYKFVKKAKKETMPSKK